MPMPLQPSVTRGASPETSGGSLSSSLLCWLWPSVLRMEQLQDLATALCSVLCRSSVRTARQRHCRKLSLSKMWWPSLASWSSQFHLEKGSAVRRILREREELHLAQCLPGSVDLRFTDWSSGALSVAIRSRGLRRGCSTCTGKGDFMASNSAVDRGTSKSFAFWWSSSCPACIQAL